jgi:restriction endonuclease Mrr
VWQISLPPKLRKMRNMNGLVSSARRRVSRSNIDLYGAVTADRAVKGVFITTSDFTVQAREFGERVGFELIGLSQLQELIHKYAQSHVE